MGAEWPARRPFRYGLQSRTSVRENLWYCTLTEHTLWNITWGARAQTQPAGGIEYKNLDIIQQVKERDEARTSNTFSARRYVDPLKPVGIDSSPRLF